MRLPDGVASPLGVVTGRYFLPAYHSSAALKGRRDLCRTGFLSPALHLARTQRGTGDRHSLAHLCAITYVTWLRIPLVESTQSGVMATTTDPPTDQEAFLVAREGGAWCEIYKLAPANKMTVGRDPASLIVLSDDKCSRRHAEIELSQDGWLIEDLNSRNGTKINGTRIDRKSVV